jgi:hypothetical protein
VGHRAPGNSAALGLAKDALKAGDVIEACGYVTKEGVIPKNRICIYRTTKHIGTVAIWRTGVTPDGKERKWSDYGYHKCWSGFRDFH